MKLPFKHLLSAGMLSAALLTTHTASAALIAYEGFDYDSPLSNGDGLGSSNGGTGWTEGWNSIGASTGEYFTPGLSHSGLESSGGGVIWKFRNGGDGRAYDATAGGTVDLSQPGSESWFSFLVQQDTAPTTGNGRLVNFYTGSAGSNNGFGVTFLTDGSIAARITGNNGTSSTETMGFGDAVYDSNGNLTGGTFGSGELSLIIGRLNFGGGTTGDDDTTLDLWLNPNDFSSVAALGTADATNTRTVADLGNYSFGSSTEMYLRTNDRDEPVNFDEIRLGTTLGDVTPIPEPSAVALLLGGLAFITVFRRRR
ncbi:MAG: PEP-CTERM sorting domain-containing protein [Verrucomicrobiota bacterium]